MVANLNTWRANKAAVALDAFALQMFGKRLHELTEVERTDAVTDLLSYTLHYAASLSLDTRTLLGAAVGDFTDETAGAQ